ncbi:MAG: hypothetical protein KBA06_02800, partial [Saprospiraceae bacterium]|nr:hypothetical protein [Saprospiraceae bacterium]
MQSENPAFDSLPNENNEDLNLHIPSEIFPNKELQRTDDTPLDNINPLDSALSTGEDEQLDLPPVLYLYEHRHIICDAKQTMIRIDKFLMDRLENVTRNKIQIAIRNNAVLVNEKPIKPNYKVRPNDVIFLLLPKKDPDSNGEVKPEDIP